MNRRLKILYLEPSAQVTGGAIALLRLVSALDRRTHRPLVVLGSDGPLAAEFRRIPGCRVLRCPLPASISRVTRFDILSGGLTNAPAALRYAFMLRHIAERWQPDIIHSNGLKMHCLSAFVRRPASLLIWHVRDFISTPYMPRRSARLFRAMARRVPDAVICNSDTTRSSMGTGYRRLHVVPDGLDWRQYNEARHSSTASRVRRIVMLGRIAAWKGQHVFVEAARRLCRTHKGVQFVIAGGAINAADAAYEVEVRHAVERYGLGDRITFTGVVGDVRPILAGADILAHCSTSPEPFGQVVIEAMAAAVPVVASQLGAPASMVQDGVNGRLVAPGDDEGLTRTLAELLADDDTRVRLGAAGLTTVRERYGIDQTVGQLVTLYRTVLGRETASVLSS